MSQPTKAWIIWDANDEWREIVRAETRNEAKKAIDEFDDDIEWIHRRARRAPEADGDFPITDRVRVLCGLRGCCDYCGGVDAESVFGDDRVYFSEERRKAAEERRAERSSALQAILAGG